jgi:nucleotide-binding universal stress UspA family protein
MLHLLRDLGDVEVVDRGYGVVELVMDLPAEGGGEALRHAVRAAAGTSRSSRGIREVVGRASERYRRGVSSAADGEKRPIVIGYDGSDFAKHAIEEAGRLFPGRRAIVANVFPSGAENVAAAAIGVPAGVLGEAAHRLHEASRQAAEERAGEGARLASEAGLAAEGRSEATEGSSWSALNGVAEEEDASAIVVGTRGLSGFKEMLLGSTSSGLLHHSTRPVVVVP